MNAQLRSTKLRLVACPVLCIWLERRHGMLEPRYAEPEGDGTVQHDDDVGMNEEEASHTRDEHARQRVGRDARCDQGHNGRRCARARSSNAIEERGRGREESGRRSKTNEKRKARWRRDEKNKGQNEAKRSKRKESRRAEPSSRARGPTYLPSPSPDPSRMRIEDEHRTRERDQGARTQDTHAAAEHAKKKTK